MLAMLSQQQLDPAATRLSGRRRMLSTCYDSRSLVQRLTRTMELDSHTGCVNTVNWSEDGNLLVSAGDDVDVCIWRPSEIGDNQQLALKFSSGHSANIFSARFMPKTSNMVVATCSLDNEIRIHHLFYTAKRSELRQIYTCHNDSVKRLVTEPDNPHLLLSCSEDGTVRQFDLRSTHSCSPSCNPPIIDYSRNRMELNSLSLNPFTPHYMAVAGSTPYVYIHDRRLIRSNTTQGAPLHAGHAISSVNSLNQGPNSTSRSSCVLRLKPSTTPDSSRALDNAKGHITSVRFSDSCPGELLASYSADHIYLFDINRNVRRPTSSLRCTDTHIKSRRRRDKCYNNITRDHNEHKRLISKGQSLRASSKYQTTPNTTTNTQYTLLSPYSKRRKRLEESHPLFNQPLGIANSVEAESIEQYNDNDLSVNSHNEDELADTDQTMTTDSNLELTMEGEDTISEFDEEESDDSIDDDNEEEEEEEEEDDDMSSEVNNEQERDIEQIQESLTSSSNNGICDSDMDVVGHSGGPYKGHSNVRTVKDVNFYGPTSSYVMSGSDCGHLFIWDKKTAEVVNVLKGDKTVVNAITSHPSRPMLACSGIDHTVKVFEPTHPSNDADDPLQQPNVWSEMSYLSELMQQNARNTEQGSRGVTFHRSLLRALLRSAERRAAFGQSEHGVGSIMSMFHEMVDEDEVEEVTPTTCNTM